MSNFSWILSLACIALTACVVDAGSAASSEPRSQPLAAESGTTVEGSHPTTAKTEASSDLDGIHGRQTFEQVCSSCHDTSLVIGTGNTKRGWQRVVDRMYQFGMTATDEQVESIVEYLSATYPPNED